jgi:hypothetical protein
VHELDLLGSHYFPNLPDRSPVYTAAARYANDAGPAPPEFIRHVIVGAMFVIKNSHTNPATQLLEIAGERADNIFRAVHPAAADKVQDLHVRFAS